MSDSATVETARKKKISPQMLIIGLLLTLPLSWMVYTFTTLTLSSGVEHIHDAALGDFKQVDLKAMGNFPFDDRVDDEKMVPEVYRSLDGQKVKLVGQMYADMSAEPTVDRFQLVYSIQNCCFNGPPKVQERIFATAPPNKKVPIYDGLAEVYGTLHVRAIRQGGKVVSLYDLEVQDLRPAR
jgi:hypothetical protein